MIARCCVASGTLCTQCRAQGRPVYGTLTLSTMLSPWGVRLLGLWDRGAEKRDRHLLLWAFHSRQVRVLCWDTWTGRNSSLGIRRSPGQVEDMEVWTTWLLSVHIEIHELMCIECTSKFKPGFALLPTGLALTTESPLWLERKRGGEKWPISPFAEVSEQFQLPFTVLQSCVNPGGQTLCRGSLRWEHSPSEKVWENQREIQMISALE